MRIWHGMSFKDQIGKNTWVLPSAVFFALSYSDESLTSSDELPWRSHRARMEGGLWPIVHETLNSANKHKRKSVEKEVFPQLN